MLPVYLLALLQTAADLDQSKAAYQRCVVAQAVSLGAGNQESADTILRVVRFKCDSPWQQLTAAFPTGTGVAIAEQARASALAKWRTDAEGAAVAALLEARSSK